MSCALIATLALSLHINESYTNSIHPGVGVDCSGFRAGAYYNSVSRGSYYAGYKYTIDDDWAIEGALVTGYEDSAVPMVKLNYKSFFAVPTEHGAVFGLQFDIGD